MHRVTRIIAVTGIVLGLVTPASPSHASIVQALELDELVAHADTIIVGRVLLSESFQRHTGHIVTWHRVLVERSLRGSSATQEEVIIETLGGTLGEVAMHVEGEPRFMVGERVVLFLRGDGLIQPLQTVGMGQGVMRIRERQGVEVVTQALEGMLLMHHNPGTGWRKSRGALPGTERLDLFLTNLRAILEHRKWAEDD